MAFDGTHRQAEPVGDVVVAVALRDEDEDIAFTLGQW
jgi:hypothetical protein